MSKVSFTVRRPTPVSRSSSGVDSDDSKFKVPAIPSHLTNGRASAPGSPLARSATNSPKRAFDDRDSSDEEDAEITEELVTGFDQFGVQRLHEKKSEGPLVIPALKNRDWREAARKRKSLYLPAGAQASTGADGSVGGLGTKDSINSGPQTSGLQVKKKLKLEEDEMEGVKFESAEAFAVITNEVKKEEEETEDQRALRAILAGVKGEDDSGLTIPSLSIPAPSEDDAYRQDVAELPEVATLDDYARVPVEQFGAAMLRGMGWDPKKGAPSKNGKKTKPMVEPYLPQARPALLGIGAKEKEVLDDGDPKKRKSGKKEAMKYMPIVKKEKEREDSAVGSRDRDRESRRYSGSPGPERRREREKERDEDSSSSQRVRYGDHSSDRDRPGDRKERRDYDRERDDDRYRDRESDRRRAGDRRRDDRRDRDRDYDHDRSDKGRDWARRDGERRRRDQ